MKGAIVSMRNSVHSNASLRFCGMYIDAMSQNGLGYFEAASCMLYWPPPR